MGFQARYLMLLQVARSDGEMPTPRATLGVTEGCQTTLRYPEAMTRTAFTMDQRVTIIMPTAATQQYYTPLQRHLKTD